MLLNTKIAKEVYALIGGEVDHASSDEHDLGDDTQVLRRLAALNLLAALGWSPNVHIWQEPHTPLHDIQRATHGRQQVPLYLHSSATKALRDTLAGLVREASARLLPADGLWGVVTAGGGAAGGGAAGGRKRRMPAAEDQVTSSTATKGRTYATQVGETPGAPPPYPVDTITMVFTQQPHQLDLSRLLTLPYAQGTSIGSLYSTAALHLSVGHPTWQELGAAVSKLQLFYMGRPLADQGSSLKEAGVQGGAVVRVLQGGQELPRCFPIHIKTLEATTYAVEASSIMLVREVKLQVQKKEGIPLNAMKIIYGGEQLEDMEELRQYDIQEGATVYRVLKMRGC